MTAVAQGALARGGQEGLAGHSASTAGVVAQGARQGQAPIARRRTAGDALLAYDGTTEGLMCCVFESYRTKGWFDVQRRDVAQPRIGQAVVDVATDMNHAWRVRRGVLRCGGRDLWRVVMEAAASDEPEAAPAVVRLVRHAVDDLSGACLSCPRMRACSRPCPRVHGRAAVREWASPECAPALKAARHTANEINRMHELMRFEHLDNDVWLAVCNPNADVVPFLMGWFEARFGGKDFLIWDEAHHVAGVSSRGKARLMRVDDASALAKARRAPEEAGVQDAWKRFYRALSIDERYHPELRRQFMPKRLWKNVVELRPDRDPDGLR